MALKKCKECGHQMSTRAAACPGCGARAPKRTSVITWLIAIILVFTVIPAVIMSSIDSNTDSRSKAVSSAPLRKQQKRAVAVRASTNRPVINHSDLDAKVSQAFYDVEKGDPPGTLANLKLAAKLAAQGANCASVTLSTYIPRSERYPGHEDQPYYVTCNAKHGPVRDFAYGVYFNEADIKGHRVKNQKQPIAKTKALVLCRQAIMQQLKFPSSADFSVLAAAVSDDGTTNREVDLDFTALNGLGNRIPQRGKCIVQPNGQTDVTILDR